MQAEDKLTIKQSQIKFHTKDKGIFLYLYPSIQHRYPRHDVIHITEQRMSFITADTINHFTYFLAVCSL